jgi:hypothetical protein
LPFRALTLLELMSSHALLYLVILLPIKVYCDISARHFNPKLITYFFTHLGSEVTLILKQVLISGKVLMAMVLHSKLFFRVQPNPSEAFLNVTSNTYPAKKNDPPVNRSEKNLSILSRLTDSP